MSIINAARFNKYSVGTGAAQPVAIAMAGMLNTEALANLPTVKSAIAGYIHASVANNTWYRYRSGWRLSRN
jgi:hypothetical protein